MLLIKTDKARDELRPGQRTLSQRERSLLLLADGRRPAQEFGTLFGGEVEFGRIAARLMQQGYLENRAAPPQALQAPQAPQAPQAAFQAPEGAAVAAAAAPTAIAVALAADSFDGKRSLATTRMFLFDLCERMFVRRDVALAARFRDELREARDRSSMLVIATAMLKEIEASAGPERAESIRQRIRNVLPHEDPSPGGQMQPDQLHSAGQERALPRRAAEGAG